MTEQSIQTSIMKWLKSEGYFCIKIMAASVNGVPDICAIRNSKTIWIEVKKEGGRLSPIQKVTISKMKRQYAEVYVVYTLQQLKEELCQK